MKKGCFCYSGFEGVEWRELMIKDRRESKRIGVNSFTVCIWFSPLTMAAAAAAVSAAVFN